MTLMIVKLRMFLYFDSPESSAFLVDANSAVGQCVGEAVVGKGRQSRDCVRFFHFAGQPRVVEHPNVAVFHAGDQLEKIK